MNTYYIGLLKRGPAWTAERSPEAIQIGLAHRKNIDDLIASDKMVLAGPFLAGVDKGEATLAGLFLYDVPSKKEAAELAESDPAVVAGMFTIDVQTWYGPKGITFEGRE